MRTTLQLWQQLADQLLVLVRVRDEGVVGLVLVQLLLGDPPQTQVVVVQPDLQLLLEHQVEDGDQADDNNQAANHAANQQDIGGTQLEGLHLLEGLLLGAHHLPDILDTLGIGTNEEKQRQGVTITGYGVTRERKGHRIVSLLQELHVVQRQGILV